MAQIEAGGRSVLIPDLIDKSFEYTIFEKDVQVFNTCMGFDTKKLGGLKDLKTEWKDQKVLDVAKVQAVVDKTGQLPVGVDAEAFEAATGQKPSAGSSLAGQKPSAGASLRVNVGCGGMKSAMTVLMVVGSAFMLL